MDFFYSSIHCALICLLCFLVFLRGPVGCLSVLWDVGCFVDGCWGGFVVLVWSSRGLGYSLSS